MDLPIVREIQQWVKSKPFGIASPEEYAKNKEFFSNCDVCSKFCFYFEYLMHILLYYLLLHIITDMLREMFDIVYFFSTVKLAVRKL